MALALLLSLHALLTLSVATVSGHDFAPAISAVSSELSSNAFDFSASSEFLCSCWRYASTDHYVDNPVVEGRHLQASESCETVTPPEVNDLI